MSDTMTKEATPDIKDIKLAAEGRRRTEWAERSMPVLRQLRELNVLRSLNELRSAFAVELSDIAFAARLRSEPDLRAAVETWLAGASGTAPAYLEWEQRKQERLLAA